jgi:hypothetical protein
VRRQNGVAILNGVIFLMGKCCPRVPKPQI